MTMREDIWEQLREREMPETAGIHASHNPKVAGSNPAPAMQEPPLARGLLSLRGTRLDVRPRCRRLGIGTPALGESGSGYPGREFRERVLEISVALGLIGALWWGFKRPEHVSRCSTSGPTNTSFARCTSHTLTAAAIHWVLIVGVGFAAGAIVGIVIVSLVPRPKHT
jgi:hypothetical protein